MVACHAYSKTNKAFPFKIFGTTSGINLENQDREATFFKLYS